jgi:chloride channel 3/4/5
VVFLIGIFMAIIAYLVDVAQATVFDWKEGYCSLSPFHNKETCCLLGETEGIGCGAWKYWTDVKTGYALYVFIATAYGVFAVSVTMLTARKLPTIDGEGKSIYMAGYVVGSLSLYATNR